MMPAMPPKSVRSDPCGATGLAGLLDGVSGIVGAAVAIGRLSAPANTVIRPSLSMRTAISAPTRLRLCARTRPVSRLMPDRPTSAFGALATTVPSLSRTTMSRRRRDVRPFSSRSIWVPPTTTEWVPPKFSSIAAFNQGVAMSSSIGPLDSRHHRPSTATVARATVIVVPQYRRRMNGRRRNLTTPRRSRLQRRRPDPCAR